MSDFLPPGCTDEMCEGYNPTCQDCGCKNDMHYDTEANNYSLIDHLKRNGNEDYYQVELNAKGEVVHACDSLINGKQCDCLGFEE